MKKVIFLSAATLVMGAMPSFVADVWATDPIGGGAFKCPKKLSRDQVKSLMDNKEITVDGTQFNGMPGTGDGIKKWFPSKLNPLYLLGKYEYEGTSVNNGQMQCTYKISPNPLNKNTNFTIVPKIAALPVGDFGGGE